MRGAGHLDLVGGVGRGDLDRVAGIEAGHVDRVSSLHRRDWTGASGGATFEDLNPYSGEVVATVAAGTREDARRAVEAARAAFPAWSQTPPAERQRIFLAAADILERRADEVVGLLTRETGCVTYGFGMFQMGFVPALLRQAAALAYSPIGQILPSDLPGAMAMGLRRPVGVVGAIFPWNAALILSARGIAAPLALGNTVVAKPSEESPFVGGLLWGRFGGQAAVDEFTELKWVTVQSGTRPFPF
jgi:acyl-CoA reductase-like NAD-dependent aldehyde dehydrogenase